MPGGEDGTNEHRSFRLYEALLYQLLEKVRMIFSQLADAVSDAKKSIPAYIKGHPEFRSIGESMIAEWDKGINGLIN
jgi:hypothetical protein